MSIPTPPGGGSQRPGPTGIGAAIGLRPDEAEERRGLDLSLHNESG